jgi:tRNA(His) 5'-end guanylyltransferase
MSEEKAPSKRKRILKALCVLFVALVFAIVIGQLVAFNSELKARVQELEDIVSLRKSETWISLPTVSEPANSYVYWTLYTNYPGYVVVTIHTSTTTNNYVEVIWSAYGINYDQRVDLSPRGSAAFPVLPADVEIRVGNTNWFSGATQTVSIAYYY